MKLGKFRKGQMAIVMTLVIATLLGVMTLCADVGVMYYNYLQLQKGADAAAVAGANYLNGGVTFASASVNANCTSEPDDAQKAACTYAISNGLATDANSFKMKENVAIGPTPNLQVIATKSNIPYMFGRVIGLSNYKVAAVATAKSTSPANTVTGLFPMGMQCTSPCSLSSIKPGSSVPFGVKFTPAEGGAPGNWQWMGSGGAQSLGASITNGMSGTWSIGDTISTSPGNKGNSGPASSAWDSRMSACASISDPCAAGSNPTNIPQGDPCLVTVPAVDFGGCNGRCSATIEGFAQIYIERTSTIKHGSNITACYVKSVDGNVVGGSPGSLNLGAIEPPKLIQ